MPLLNRKPDLEPQYSKTDQECEGNLKIIENDPIDTDDDDWLADLDMSPREESNESLIADMEALFSDEENAIEIAASKAEALPAQDDWLNEVRALARKHGPFDSGQIMEVIRTLNAPADGSVR